MPRITPQTELDRLVALVSEHQDGLGIDAIAQRLENTLLRRTLQRRLALLVEQGRIQMLGEARSVRYVRQPPSVQGVLAAQEEAGDTMRAVGEDYVPTSAEGAEVKAFVRQPRALRPPVGYKLEFLEQYHPNHSAYLSPGLRDQLHALGRSPADQTPAGTFARDMLNRLLIDLSWASSQLEGNTYSRLDTERLIEFGQAAEGKGALETQMILNHKQAVELRRLQSCWPQLRHEVQSEASPRPAIHHRVVFSTASCTVWADTEAGHFAPFAGACCSSSIACRHRMRVILFVLGLVSTANPRRCARITRRA
jgi:hypothetical protein